MGRTDCRTEELTEKALFSKTVFEGKVFDCLVNDVELSDGSISFREIVRHTGGACILPVDSDLNCYLVRQFRSGADQVLLEVPAGKIEVGEDPKACAAREITEETGFEAGNIISLGHIFATPAYCSEKIHLYIGTDLHYVGSSPDSGEFLGVEKIPLTDLVAMCDDGRICDSKTTVLIYKAARRFIG